MRISRRVRKGRFVRFAGTSAPPHELSTAVDNVAAAMRLMPLSTAFPHPAACGQPGVELVRLYWPAAGRRRLFPSFGSDFPGETDLSAERAQAEEEARLPQPHADTRRPPHPQAP